MSVVNFPLHFFGSQKNLTGQQDPQKDKLQWLNLHSTCRIRLYASEIQTRRRSQCMQSSKEDMQRASPWRANDQTQGRKGSLYGYCRTTSAQWGKCWWNYLLDQKMFKGFSAWLYARSKVQNDFFWPPAWSTKWFQGLCTHTRLLLVCAQSPVAELTPEPTDGPSLWTGGSHRSLCWEDFMLSPII